MFEETLPIALLSGVGIQEYWDLTFGEIVIILKNYQKKEEARVKEQLSTTYNTAQLVASFVGLSMNGKDIPTIEEVFPSVFQKQVKEEDITEREVKAMALQKDIWVAYAERFNKQRQKGGVKAIDN